MNKKLIFSYIFFLIIISSLIQSKSNFINFAEEKILDYNKFNLAYNFGIGAEDIDNDGDIDITIADAKPNNRLFLLRNINNEKYNTEFIKLKEAKHLERHDIGDIDQDGFKDIVVVKNYYGEIIWFRNNQKKENEQWTQWSRYVISKNIKGAYDVELIDFDNDGDLDVAVSTWKIGDGFFLLINDNKTENWNKILIDKVQDSHMIRLGDIDNDGDQDLIGTSRKDGLVILYENIDFKRFKKRIIDTSAFRPAHGSLSDLDNDGDLDLVLAGGKSKDNFKKKGEIVSKPVLVWYENLLNELSRNPRRHLTKGKQLFNWKKNFLYESTSGGFESATGDLDNDGDEDIVLTIWNKGQILLFINDNLKFKKQILKENIPGVNQVILRDLNNDNQIDIIVSSDTPTNKVFKFINKK